MPRTEKNKNYDVSTNIQEIYNFLKYEANADSIQVKDGRDYIDCNKMKNIKNVLTIYARQKDNEISQVELANYCNWEKDAKIIIEDDEIYLNMNIEDLVYKLISNDKYRKLLSNDYKIINKMFSYKDFIPDKISKYIFYRYHKSIVKCLVKEWGIGILLSAIHDYDISEYESIIKESDNEIIIEYIADNFFIFEDYFPEYSDIIIKIKNIIADNEAKEHAIVYYDKLTDDFVEYAKQYLDITKKNKYTTTNAFSYKIKFNTAWLNFAVTNNIDYKNKDLTYIVIGWLGKISHPLNPFIPDIKPDKSSYANIKEINSDIKKLIKEYLKI
jgi:hypothetical protein